MRNDFRSKIINAIRYKNEYSSSRSKRFLIYEIKYEPAFDVGEWNVTDKNTNFSYYVSKHNDEYTGKIEWIVERLYSPDLTNYEGQTFADLRR